MRKAYLLLAGVASAVLLSSWIGCSEEAESLGLGGSTPTGTITSITDVPTTSTTTTGSGGASCDAVQDPSFEAGTPSSVWEEGSTKYGTPLCSADTCNQAGAYQGDWWAWFGGVTGAYEEDYLRQSVTVPSGSTTLSFYLELVSCDTPSGNGIQGQDRGGAGGTAGAGGLGGAGGAAGAGGLGGAGGAAGAGGLGGSGGAGGGTPAQVDYLEITMDGHQLFLVDASSPNCGATSYSQQTLDISAYADGAAHMLELHSETFGLHGAESNFYVDVVSIDICP